MMKTNLLHLSVNPTYDSRKTGHRYSVSSWLCGEQICQKNIADPFVRHTIKIHWWDAIKCLIKTGGIRVEVNIDGDLEIMEDVLELDGNYLRPGGTRRAEFESQINHSLSCMSEVDASRICTACGKEIPRPQLMTQIGVANLCSACL